jgi:hypothetical protein
MASTKRAYAICDICGFRYKYNQLRKNSYGMLVCPEDWEGSYDMKNHPQNKTPNVRDDEFLKDPRPPTNFGRNKNWEDAYTNWEDTNSDWNTI